MPILSGLAWGATDAACTCSMSPCKLQIHPDNALVRVSILVQAVRVQPSQRPSCAGPSSRRLWLFCLRAVEGGATVLWQRRELCISDTGAINSPVPLDIYAFCIVVMCTFFLYLPGGFNEINECSRMFIAPMNCLNRCRLSEARPLPPGLNKSFSYCMACFLIVQLCSLA